MKGKKFFCSPKHPDCLWGLPSPLFSGYQGSFLRVKRPDRDVEHSLPCSAEVKNGWRCTSTPPTSLHGVDMDNFTYLTHSTDKKNPITGLDRPLGFQEFEAHRFIDNRHMKVVRSALRIGRLYPPGNIPGTHFC
jgi:hypothetical protein